ncbi:MAG: class I SAM-dependent methyltransferase [Gammaproteobacteria bacterium]
MSDLSNSFGFQRVEQAEREQRIRQVFEAVAPRYDLMNDVMSFGIHRLWKRVLARAARPAAGQVIVDVAGGTGDVARLLAHPDRQVVICDPSSAMMRQGRTKGLEHIACVAGTGEAIPLADDSVDTATIAFGLRNMTHLPAALAEMVRVLKPGGRLLVLEFSKPWAVIRPFYDAYSFHVIPRLGAWIARQPIAYTYLVESIRRFPDQRELQRLLEAAGLRDVRYRNLSFGIACLHVGTKPG